MEIIKTVSEMQNCVNKLRLDRKCIGLVPTMGYLHEGHLSLIDRIEPYCDVIIVSVFVNPAQFGPNEDFEEYPRDLERDAELLEKRGAHILFSPPVSDVYPVDYFTYVHTEKLTDRLCGKFRPGHFKGVTSVVAKLFNMTKPHIAVFGEKDYQQVVVLKKMTKDLNFDIKIITAPTIREQDGLAKSSRNSYLTVSERKDAPLIYKSLQHIKNLVKNGETDCSKLKKEMTRIIDEGKTLKIQYTFIGDPEKLEEWDKIKGKTLIACAVFAGKTRLIDNIVVRP